MPYDARTGLYTSQHSFVPPSHPLSIYNFVFPHTNADAAPSPSYSRSDPTGKVWLVDAVTSKTLTAEGAKDRTHQLAKVLVERGVGEGARKNAVVIVAGNHLDLGCLLWATWRQGGIISTINPNRPLKKSLFSLRKADSSILLRAVSSYADIKVVVVSSSAARTVSDAAVKSGISTDTLVLMGDKDPAVAEASSLPTLDKLATEAASLPLPPAYAMKEEDARSKVALLSFSSGTTGAVKGLLITHFAFICNVLQACVHKKLMRNAEEDDVLLGCVPLFHAYGLVAILHLSVYENTKVVLLPKFTRELFFSSISKFKITHLSLVPPMLLAMLAAPKDVDFSSVRFVLCGAAPLAGETAAAFAKRLPQAALTQGYGMSEGVCCISLGSPTDPHLAASGRFCPGIEAKIVSPEGKLLPPGEAGELLIRGPALASGYLDNEQATKETFDTNGFLHTGDEIKIDQEGYVFVVDRLKELIKSSGMQVAPAELEGLLLTNPDVADVAVIGVPHDRRVEAPYAYVVPGTHVDLTSRDSVVKSIKDFVLEHKAKYKALSGVSFVDEIPKSPSGKLLRRQLRTRYAVESAKDGSKL